MISGVLRTLLSIPAHNRDFRHVLTQLMQCPVVEPVDGAVTERSSKLMNQGVVRSEGQAPAAAAPDLLSRHTNADVNTLNRVNRGGSKSSSQYGEFEASKVCLCRVAQRSSMLS